MIRFIVQLLPAKTGLCYILAAVSEWLITKGIASGIAFFYEKKKKQQKTDCGNQAEEKKGKATSRVVEASDSDRTTRDKGVEAEGKGQIKAKAAQKLCT